MDSRLIFIYDGQCPFCNHFAELMELKSGLSNISFKNGREHLSELTELYKKGFDLDKGAILIKNNEIFHGAKAISLICSEIDKPSDSLLEIIRVIFSSQKRSSSLFPFLIWARRALLFLKGIPIKPVNSNLQFF